MTPPVRSVAQAFAILRLFVARAEPMTLSDVAREQGISPSSCLNLLRALVAEGALVRDEAGRRYRLAPEWAASGVLDNAASRFVARLQPALTAFAAQHDAAIGLWQQVGGTRLALVGLAESEAATRIHMALGQRQPIGGGSIGRALAAAARLDETALRRRFAALRWQKPLGFAAWRAQVQAAAHDGYAIDDGYGHAGICSIGVVMPVVNPQMTVCLSASVFAGSLDRDAIATLGRALAEFARGRAIA